MTGQQTGGVVGLVMTIPLALMAVVSIAAEAKQNPNSNLVSFGIGSFLWSFLALVACPHP